MAISNNLWLKGARQRLGGVVLYQAQGETRMRELAPSVSNPRTAAQMAQRVRWANLVNFYRANAAWMKRAFETKPQNNTDYNRFMSLNGSTSNIYLTKQEANAGACVVTSYRITDGTLESVEISASGEDWVSNIFTGSLAVLDVTTTVGAFATALLSVNGGLRVGDQLSFIRISQMTNANTGYPYIIVRTYEVLLNPASSALLSDYLPINYFEIGTLDGNPALGIVNSGQAGAFALIISRTEGGVIRVSSQDLVVANNDALISRYSSAAQQQSAADSYGEGTEVFLSSASAGEIGGLVQAISPVSFNVGTDIYTSVDEGPTWENIESGIVGVSFNGPITATTYQVTMTFYNGGNPYTTDNIAASIIGNSISFVCPAIEGARDAWRVYAVNITLDGVLHTLQLSYDGGLG